MVKPVTMATVMPMAALVRPPEKMPARPLSAMASMVPWVSRWPKPLRGTVAPAPAKSIKGWYSPTPVSYTHLTDAVAISKHEGLIADVVADPCQTSAGLCVQSGIHQGDPPWLGDVVMHGHFVAAAEVEGDVGGMQVVVGKVFLDDIALVA